MDPKTNKLLQQAGKYILLGKLSLALEQYLKIHAMEPEDSTIINNIADLYSRLDDRDQALEWYHRLAQAFESRQQFANAVATYKKILKISPKNQEAIIRLAELYEHLGQIPNAKLQYRLVANQWMSFGEYDKALAALQKICDFDPYCHDSQQELAQFLQQFGRHREAAESYLTCARILSQKGNKEAALAAVDNILRIRPDDREFLRSLLELLQGMDLIDRAAELLHSLSLEEDPEFKVLLAQMFLESGNREVAKKYLSTAAPKNPQMYSPTVKLLEVLIAEGDLGGSLDIVDAILETAIEMKDSSRLRVMLDSMLELDGPNIRTLKALTTLLIRTDDRLHLEEYLKRLVILQLRMSNLREARDSFNKMVVYGQSSFYLDLLNVLNEAMISGSESDLSETCRQIIQALERGDWEREDSLSGMGLALGVSDLDLGMGLVSPAETPVINESTCEIGV
ncbi:MAG: tetratricopeptide repeat protein [Acidobacteriota bacterium]